MFCEHCGAPIEEGTKFCTKCGQPVRKVSIPAMQEQQPDPPRKKVLTGIIITMSVIVVILVSVIAAMLIYKANDKEQKTETRYQRNKDDDKEDEKVEEESSTQLEETAETEPIEEQTTEAETVAVEQTVYRTLASDEQILADKIAQMNSSGYSSPTIDVYSENYVPGTRDYNATWDNTLFYEIEGIHNPTVYYDKNNCYLIKRQTWTAASGNKIDYEVYENPDTLRPNKIVSLEYLVDGLEVTEYYYTNEGTINFIFQYYTDNYVSTYAEPSMPGSRFLFHNDCMVTWRVIGADSTVNYVLGTAEADRMKHQFASSTIRYYQELPEEKRKAFDETEKKMLNAAYNTYYYIMNAEGVAMIQGYVDNADESGLEGTNVALFTNDFEAPLYTTLTDINGKYSIYVPVQEYVYNLRFSKDGYSDNDVYQVSLSNNQIEASQDTVYLFTPDMPDANVELKLGDALNYAEDGTSMQALDSATIYVRKGLNNRAGEVLDQMQSDSNGRAVLNLSPGMYTVEVASSGFENMYYNVMSNPRRSQNFYELYATPDLEEGEIRIVLTWGATPSDLDSHLFTTSGNMSDHVWFGDSYDMFGNNLDVDDTTSYGPETITIPDFTNDNYYKYCVTDYTNCCGGYYSSQEMSYSGACVNVYSSNGLIATFHVPAAREGVIWEVFEIRKGDITPIQRYYNTVTDKDWWSHE